MDKEGTLVSLQSAHRHPKDIAINAQPGVRNHLSEPSTENW